MNHKEFPTSRPPQWARQFDEESFSWQGAVGGWRDFIGSILPGLVFAVCFVVTRDVMLTSTPSAGTALIALAARLLRRQSISQAISGFFGVGIDALWALASGKGEDFYASGLIISAFFFLGVLLTILIGRPFISIGVGAFWALPKGRWYFERFKPLVGRCVQLSWLQAGVFAFRLAIEVPLWWMDQVAQLGVAKLILGVPLLTLAARLSRLGLRPFGQLVDQGNEAQDETGK